jgi:hypothetical protein
VVGGLAGTLIIKMLYPGVTPAQAATVVLPHETAADGNEAAGHDMAARRPAATAASDGTAPGGPGQAGR